MFSLCKSVPLHSSPPIQRPHELITLYNAFSIQCCQTDLFSESRYRIVILTARFFLYFYIGTLPGQFTNQILCLSSLGTCSGQIFQSLLVFSDVQGDNIYIYIYLCVKHIAGVHTTTFTIMTFLWVFSSDVGKYFVTDRHICISFNAFPMQLGNVDAIFF